MKKIEESPWYLVALAAIVIGGMCHIAFGWKFAPVVVAIALIWISAKTTKWLLIIAVVLVGWQLFTSFLPQTASKGPFGLLQTDLFAARQIDSVQIKANIILEAEKNRQKQAALGKYTELVRAGRAQEAQALLDSIDRVFTIKPADEVAPVRNNTVTTLPMGTTTIPMLVNQGDESVWYKFPENCTTVEYSFKSPDNGFVTFFTDDETAYPGGVDHPDKTDPVFRFKALKKNQVITITVVRVN
ncbi:MAG: hypothetical protein Q8Q67_04140 [bacterium]|nr:hypothetical protein [bacterium]